MEGSCPTATPFQTWAWQRAWWNHYRGRKGLRIFTVREGNDLVGIMPMTRSLGLWRTLRPAGVGPSDYLHPLALGGYESAVAQAVHERFTEEKDVDLVDLHQVRESSALAACSWGSRIEQAKCLVLDLPHTYDAFLSSLGKSLRYDVRKLDRECDTQRRCSIETIDASHLEEGLEIFFRLHKSRWRKRMQPGAFTSRSRAFLSEWSRAAVVRGELRLNVLRFDGNLVGALYAMAVGPSYYYYQAGFDPNFSAISPGTLLVSRTIRQAIDEGKSGFDFLRGDEPYKRRWKPQRTFANLRLLTPAAGALGRWGAAWNDAGSRIEGRVRARFEGRGVF